MEIADKPRRKVCVHFPGNEEKFDELGIWTWGDVEYPSESVGSWPFGALTFLPENSSEYGRFVEIELADDPQLIGFLINSHNGDNLSGDLYAKILSEEMNDLWVTADYQVFYYQPLQQQIRLHFDFPEETKGYCLNVWNEDKMVKRYQLPSDKNYIDINKTAVNPPCHLVMEQMSTGWQSEKLAIQSPKSHSQYFFRKDDPFLYTNPYFIAGDNIIAAKIISNQDIGIFYTNTVKYHKTEMKKNIQLINKDGKKYEFHQATQITETCLMLSGNVPLEEMPLTLQHFGQAVNLTMDWKIKDDYFATDEELGPKRNKDGTALLKVWSPSADWVKVKLYDKHDASLEIPKDIPMNYCGNGVWNVLLNKENTGLADITGYYYRYLIGREETAVLALDPYAKSLATWKQHDYIGKAAIIDPSTIGPALDYAEINGYQKREDAIIYEVHVRDFTSDPSIGSELRARFGTFSAFAEKLDYIADLGVTHIQLLPVMSYFYCDESKSGARLLEYDSFNQHYNWGYDPHNYFSLSGMYSENPDDPVKRIEEFKHLVAEIHRSGMGVILDVVYNHTAKVRILENLEPNYYHFMNADSTTRRSFGGGRLGTTHKMTRRLVIDSIKYWLEEFKVDGFRFDMMGDLDAETVQHAYHEAKKVNPNVLMIGEGWRTYAGDETDPHVTAADQDWMTATDSVGCFADELRNELRSGYGCEGEPRFLTNGARDISAIFHNLIARPGNFETDAPGDVVQYIEAHDNLTLHDVIAYSINKDPSLYVDEIHQRIRLAHVLLLTSQGTVFLHAGSEYGRTKQFLKRVIDPPYKSTFVTDQNGEPISYPYFIHDSYRASDSINQFDWQKAVDQERYPIHTKTSAYIKGLIHLRRSTDAFRFGEMEQITENVQLLSVPEIESHDLVIAYLSVAKEGVYYVFVNADQYCRTLTLPEDLLKAEIIADGENAGTKNIEKASGFVLSEKQIRIDPLTAIILRS
ncbi:pullulanase [Gracilibacillus oryzae]|uniref:pullulanase n=1 Tax=Gracilibacillus oryzae TaxID=1672701 RepID=A0A7C8GRQ6_9BACI|nr:pullulanase [Gracilibacillus oryzae]KAB8127939.1 pullulanase [Gracilibacillus oryzae]